MKENIDLRNTRKHDIILKVRNLSKSYGLKKVVDKVTFDIHKGQCFGLLGPNGSGKTTTMEMIEQITQSDSGELLFKENKPSANFPEYLGVQFQETVLPLYLTVKECLETFQNLYNNSIPLNDLMNLCQLHDFKDQRHDRISGGQRQRLLLAIALCNNAEVLLLDEPTTGLDPQARRHLWEVIKEIKKNGTSIILTTHYMEEAGELCDEIAIMDQGHVIALGNPRELLKKNFNFVSLSGFNTDTDIFNVILSEDEFFISNGIVFTRTDNLNHVLKKLIDADVSLQELRIKESSLEDLFLKLTGEHLRR